MHRLRLIASVILSGSAVFAASPETPKELRPPDGQVLLFRLHGEGTQIYVCRNAANLHKWSLKAPDATLTDENGRPAGRHFAAPIWEAPDGSRVSGKLVATVPSPDSDSIPWLLLTAMSRSGTGVMDKVESIQRLDTKGGVAPVTGCTAATENTETAVRYEANYLFYGTPGGE